jgi:hypothetical protein
MPRVLSSLTLALAPVMLVSAVCGGPAEPTENTPKTGYTRGERTGLAECDVIMEAYVECFDNHAPAQVRERLKTNMEYSFGHWVQYVEKDRDSPNRPERLENFRRVCKAALTSWERTTAALGCKPPPRL